jgi:hypothetical protein
VHVNVLCGGSRARACINWAVLSQATSTACAMIPPIGGSSSSSSSSSSSDDRREFHELIRRADEAHQGYFDATYKVSQLEHYLDAVNDHRRLSPRPQRPTLAVTAAAGDLTGRTLVGGEVLGGSQGTHVTYASLCIT